MHVFIRYINSFNMDLFLFKKIISNLDNIKRGFDLTVIAVCVVEIDNRFMSSRKKAEGRL